eukprot:3463608-Prymnesium_polylepis.7
MSGRARAGSHLEQPSQADIPRACDARLGDPQQERSDDALAADVCNAERAAPHKWLLLLLPWDRLRVSDSFRRRGAEFSIGYAPGKRTCRRSQRFQSQGRAFDACPVRCCLMRF